VTTFAAQWLIVVSTLLVVMVSLALARRQTNPKRPQLPVRTFPLAGCDPVVAQVIEEGGSDEALIREAEIVAEREYRREQTGPPRVVSIPHVTATTPTSVTPWVRCPDCEFDQVSSLDGFVMSVLTSPCPVHQRRR